MACPSHGPFKNGETGISRGRLALFRGNVFRWGCLSKLLKRQVGVNVMVKNSISNELAWGEMEKKTEEKKTSRFQVLMEQMDLFQWWGMLMCPPQKRPQCPFGCPQERGTEKCSKCRTLAKTLHVLQRYARCLKVFKIDQEGKIGLLWVYILRRTFENS